MKRYRAKAIARILGLPQSEVESLTKTGVITEGYLGGGLYDLEISAREIIQNYRKADSEKEHLDYAQERAKMMRIRRLSEEDELALRRKELHRAEDIELIISKMLVSFKARLNSLPSRIAPQAAKLTDSAEIFDIVKEIVDECLTELSDYDALFNEEDEDDQREHE